MWKDISKRCHGDRPRKDTNGHTTKAHTSSNCEEDNTERKHLNGICRQICKQKTPVASGIISRYAAIATSTAADRGRSGVMSYYDEEITISDPDTKQLSHIKVDRLPSSSSGRAPAGMGLGPGADRAAAAGSRQQNRNRTSKTSHGNSTDDDGLLQDIIDHDDDEDDENDEDDDGDGEGISSMPKPMPTQPIPATFGHTGGTRAMNFPTVKALDNDTEASETDSEEGGALGQLSGGSKGVSPTIADVQLSITPDKWQSLTVNQEVKDLFPYILKYTPQNIETPYHLQPFIPEFVPAVGDVDAFLKVTVPALLQPQRQHEVNEHLRKMGLHCLDEPSGEQSEPSLLNMKLRSVLTGSGVNPRSASASLVPTAKSPKDIDKWIAEVEQVHMTHSSYDAQPRKDIETLLLDWPRAYADACDAVQDAYQRCLREDISLQDYIRVLCQHFGVEGASASDTQADYILNVHTLFALYLAANQAWE